MQNALMNLFSHIKLKYNHGQNTLGKCAITCEFGMPSLRSVMLIFTKLMPCISHPHAQYSVGTFKVF